VSFSEDDSSTDSTSATWDVRFTIVPTTGQDLRSTLTVGAIETVHA